MPDVIRASCLGDGSSLSVIPHMITQENIHKLVNLGITSGGTTEGAGRHNIIISERIRPGSSHQTTRLMHQQL
jgi:hypothetical protein